jgi:hypothetical protein
VYKAAYKSGRAHATYPMLHDGPSRRPNYAGGKMQ